MRLFTAIELPKDVCDRLIEAQEELKNLIASKLSWTALQNLHLTLKFLGEVADAEVMRIRDALMSISQPRFTISMAQLGGFPPRGPARVLMAEVAGQSDALIALNDAIERACEPLGFEREKRAYHPHVTLARLRVPRKISREIEAVKLKPTQPFEVCEFMLMQSRLSPKGSQYERVATVALT